MNKAASRPISGEQFVKMFSLHRHLLLLASFIIMVTALAEFTPVAQNVQTVIRTAQGDQVVAQIQQKTKAPTQTVAPVYHTTVACLTGCRERDAVATPAP
jgi:hypothetical protein